MREVEVQVELLCSAHGNVTFLNNSCVVIEGVQFVGSTLWTWVPLELRPLVQRTVLDFSLVLAGEGRFPLWFVLGQLSKACCSCLSRSGVAP